MNAAEIARRLEGRRLPSGDYQCRCPVPSHGRGRGDRNPSLSVADGDKGIVVHCHAGCDARDVLAEVGYQPKRNGATNGANGAKPQRRIVALYNYTDERRTLLYQSVRYEPKDFSQRRPNPDAPGQWIWNLQGVQRVPYRLPEMLAAVHDTVFVVEGEKDADALAALGFVATSASEGAGKWKPDLNPYFKGKTVYVLPDNDEPGRKHARQVAENLTGVAASVRVVRLPGLPDKGDVSDWLAGGNDPTGLLALCEATPEWQPEKVKEETGEAAETDDDLGLLNAKYCVVRDGGRTRVLTFDPRIEKEHRRLVPTFMSFEDFRNFHCNKKVKVGDRSVPLGHWWLTHPERQQYDGLTFQPGEGQEIEGRLNLWRGWGVEPEAGDWSLMRRHIEYVLAAGDTSAAAYIINWVAWAFQNPAKRAQAAVVFKGAKGTGKGTLGNALCRIFGQHGTHISSAEHLAGRFNGHLRDACLLFADEAYWPGDKGAEGSLKRLVTEPDLFIEAKGRDGVTVPNMLHIIMASNEDWIVPAGEDERRYAVFEVSNCHKQDEAWFKPLYAEMEAGGLGAMLYDLLRLDLGDWHPRRIPKTSALLEQQARGLSPEDEWWVGLLEAGQIPASDPRDPSRAVSGDYVTKGGLYGDKETKHQGLYHYARVSSPRLRGRSDTALGRFLNDQGCKSCRVLRQRGWEFPALSAARAAWERRFPGWKWHSPDTTNWHSDEE